MRRTLPTIAVLSLSGAWAIAGVPSSQPTQPNAWVKVADGVGPRTSFGLVYGPLEQDFITFSGSMQMDTKADGSAGREAATAPYSELTLNLKTGAWENRFPLGKEWGPAAGPSKAPPFAGSYYAFKTKDVEDNTRPYLGAGYYNGMWTWGNYALDTDRNVVVMYWTISNQTAEYDLAKRTWTLTASADKMPQEFRDGMIFGAMCYDPINKEVIGGQGQWAYKDGQWRQLELGSPQVTGLHAKAEALHRRSQTLAGAVRGRYYLAESADEAKVDLKQSVTTLAADLGELVRNMIVIQVKKGDASVELGALYRYENQQGRLATAALTAAIAFLKKAEPLLASVTPDAIFALDDARRALAQAVIDLSVCPPRRGHVRMVYDAANKKIVMFGGDTLDRYLGDTWVYDCAARRWEQPRPALSPAPRAGYKLAYLPKSGKALMIDGYGYKGAGEMWVYDVKANTWSLLQESGRPDFRPAGHEGYPVPAAASADDVVVTLLGDRQAGLATWAVKVDPSRMDADGTAKRGVAPLTETPYARDVEDPQWFEKNAPAPDPAAEEKVLANLPANTWVRRDAPNWPKTDYPNSKCWGSCALDSDRSQLLHWGGGHATYDGNDVLHYSIRANRFYITYRPEHMLSFAGFGIGIPECNTYKDRPFIQSHSYHAYDYDPTLKRMVLGAVKSNDRLFTYDPNAGLWARDLVTPFYENGFIISEYQSKVATTPQGVVAWVWKTGELWRVNAAKMTWDKIPAEPRVASPGWDENGLVCDTKRDRLLLFGTGEKGTVTAVDLKTGATTVLKPENQSRGAVSSREAIYLPELDAVLIGARPAGPADPTDRPRWLLYDCGKNVWLAIAFAGPDPIEKERFNVSLGLMYDPTRHLVWAMDRVSRPHVLRLDVKTADVK